MIREFACEMDLLVPGISKFYFRRIFLIRDVLTRIVTFFYFFISLHLFFWFEIHRYLLTPIHSNATVVGSVIFMPTLVKSFFRLNIFF